MVLLLKEQIKKSWRNIRVYTKAKDPSSWLSTCSNSTDTIIHARCVWWLKEGFVLLGPNVFLQECDSSWLHWWWCFQLWSQDLSRESEPTSVYLVLWVERKSAKGPLSSQECDSFWYIAACSTSLRRRKSSSLIFLPTVPSVMPMWLPGVEAPGENKRLQWLFFKAICFLLCFI